MYRSSRYPTAIVLLLATVVIGAAACAAGAAAGGGGSSNVLTAVQLENQPVTNLYDAVQRLRPRWLLERGATTLNAAGNPVVVYVNDQRMGGVAELHNVVLSSVGEVRYLDASSATMRWGTGHTSGAILVTIKR